MEKSYVVLQLITVTWHKSARQASKATLRNQLPEAFALPATISNPHGQIFIHRVTAKTNLGGIQQTSEWFERIGLPHIGNADLEINSDKLIVLLRPDLKWTELPRPRMTLGIREWGRFKIQEGRATSGFSQIIGNVGFFDELNPSLFTAKSPQLQHEIQRD